jgi:hypothetical protein
MNTVHIFVRCWRAGLVRSSLGIHLTDSTHKKPWLLGFDLTFPDQVCTDVALVLLWHIWKARNSKIFEQQDLPPREVIGG